MKHDPSCACTTCILKKTRERRSGMKRLCVFYYNSREYLGKKIEWIVCKECQKKLRNGTVLRALPASH